jgi:hypothetical protein
LDAAEGLCPEDKGSAEFSRKESERPNLFAHTAWLGN